MRRLLTAAFVLALAAAAVFDPGGVVDHLRLRAFDRFQALHPRAYVDAGVRIVDIDDDSLAKFGQWPWPRDLMARMVTKATEAGASVIALDMVFAEPDRTSPRDRPADHDPTLAEAIRAARMVVTGFMLNQRDTGQIPLIKTGVVFHDRAYLDRVPRYRGAIANIDVIAAASAGNGSFSWRPDNDLVIRRVPALVHLGDGLFYPSLSLEALRIATSGRSIRVRAGEGVEPYLAGVEVGTTFIPTTLHGEVPLYLTAPAAERYIPAWKLLDPGFDLGQLAGKAVFVGTSASGLHDRVLTPAGHSAPGVEAHAQALEQMLLGVHLRRPWWLPAAEAAAAVVLGLVLVAALARLLVRGSLVATAGILLAVWTGSWLAFVRAGWLLDPVLPTICVASAFVVSMIVERARLEGNRRGD